MNANETAIRAKKVKDETQKVVKDFIMSGKTYDCWNFLDFDPDDRDYKFGGTYNTTNGNNDRYLIITNQKIQADQIANDQPLIKLAIYWLLKMGVNEIHLFNISGKCPSYDIPKFTVEGSCYYCGPEPTIINVKSE